MSQLCSSTNQYGRQPSCEYGTMSTMCPFMWRHKPNKLIVSSFESSIYTRILSTMTCVAWIISIKSSALPLLGLVRCAGRISISSPCPVWEWSFSSVLFLELRCLFLLLPLVILETLFLCKETIQCRSTTSEQKLIPHYNATTLSLSCTLGDKIGNAR